MEKVIPILPDKHSSTTLYNKLPFAELIRDSRINPELSLLLNKTNRILNREEIINLCKIYQKDTDIPVVEKNIDKLNARWGASGIQWN